SIAWSRPRDGSPTSGTGPELAAPEHVLDEILRRRAPDRKRALAPGFRDDSRVAGQALSLVAGDGERMVVGAGDRVPCRVRGAVRVAAGGEHLAHRVADREDDHAPVVERVVEGEDRRLLTAVRRLRGGERRGDLVGELALLPEMPGPVHELLQL